MTTPARARYTGYRFPAEIISHAVWLYFRFPLGLRMVEELLAARGIYVSQETVRQWAQIRPAVRQPDPSPAPAHRRQMASRRGRAQDRRCEALVMARGGPDRDRARCFGSTPPRQASGQAAVAQTAEEADATATRHDHRQACQLRRGQKRGDARH